MRLVRIVINQRFLTEFVRTLIEEEGITKPAIVPCPVELLSLRQEPVELSSPAIIIADKAPVQHLYIAGQIQNDLSNRFGINSVVVSDCEANVGDIVSATFYIPAMEQNGYYDRIQDKLEMVNP